MQLFPAVQSARISTIHAISSLNLIPGTPPTQTPGIPDTAPLARARLRDVQRHAGDAVRSLGLAIDQHGAQLGTGGVATAREAIALLTSAATSAQRQSVSADPWSRGDLAGMLDRALATVERLRR